MIYGGECLISSGGKLLSQGPRFSYERVQVTTAVIDLDVNRAAQAEQVSFDPSNTENLMVIETESEWRSIPFEIATSSVAKWEFSTELKHEEFSRAIALGLWDYLEKSKQKGYAVSLSGGADSCSVMVLIRDMVELALNELGNAGFLKRLKKVFPGGENESGEIDLTVKQVMSHLLDSFYQPADASSEKTLESAKAVAEGVGAYFNVIDVSAMVDLYTQATENFLDRTLSWDNPGDDLTLQNIQARVRGVQGWTIANATGKILIPPGNMSEIMVGYFTQGGDDSGGVNPIGGVKKSYLKTWLEWRESYGPEGLPPLPFLSFVNKLAFTAELRPIVEGVEEQTDEGELGPYVVRDDMEDLFLRDRLSPIEIFDRLQIINPQHSADEHLRWIKKFFWLFSINQWKRERLPVTFHVDDHNLSPRNWLRWPVLSGNFEEELNELTEYVLNL